MTNENETLPVPPMRYRYLVGPLNDAAYENPTGDLIFGTCIPAENYESVFDFGCGCGRTARMLLQQRHVPTQYMGIDVSRQMVDWCREAYTPLKPNFKFVHHDVHSLHYGSTNSDRKTAPFPVPDNSFTLFMAISVFTHLVPRQTEFYLSEMSRILKPGGMAQTTWFFFNKSQFPMMPTYLNALYIDSEDPTNAVIYDEQYVRNIAEDNDLDVLYFMPGYQSQITFRKRGLETSKKNQAKYRWVPAPAVQVTNNEAKSSDSAAAEANSNIQCVTAAQDIKGMLTHDDRVLIDSPAISSDRLPCVFSIQNTGTLGWPTYESPGAPDALKFNVEWTHIGNGVSSSTLHSIPGDVVAPGELATVPIMLQVPSAPGEYQLKISLFFRGLPVEQVSPLLQAVNIETASQS